MKRKRRPFTPAEDAQLIALRLKHYGCKGRPPKGHPGGMRTIGKIMGRDVTSIRERLKILARREED